MYQGVQRVLSMFHNNIAVCSAAALDMAQQMVLLYATKSNIIYAQIIEEGNYEGMIGGSWFGG